MHLKVIPHFLLSKTGNYSPGKVIIAPNDV